MENSWLQHEWVPLVICVEEHAVRWFPTCVRPGALCLASDETSVLIATDHSFSARPKVLRIRCRNVLGSAVF